MLTHLVLDGRNLCGTYTGRPGNDYRIFENTTLSLFVPPCPACVAKWLEKETA